MPKAFLLDRRSFFLGAASAGAGLFHRTRSGGSTAEAAATGPEINAWVVVKPDDTIVDAHRALRDGQGSLTGLAQLVAEELEADWSKVTTEYPTPGESHRRKAPVGRIRTGGSRGIRISHEYVRKGGAAARIMLVQAAANAWSVPASECRAKSVITHAPTGRTTTFGKVSGRGGETDAAGRRPIEGSLGTGRSPASR